MSDSKENEVQKSPPVLEFDHNVIEHLGIRLYQNKPGNVLAEIVANSWDADAKQVFISTSARDAPSETRFLSVADNGSGMDFETIRSRYLVIGKPKRNSAKMKSPGGRGPMGRKGIGKLAPFGIARSVDVVTCANNKISWFTLDLDDLIAAATKRGSYPPSFTLEDQDLLTPLPSSATADIVAFVDRVRASTEKTGTLVRMRRLTSNDDLDRNAIQTSLANKFTVVLNRPDFSVSINDQPIDKASAIPKFELRIPAEGYVAETLAAGEVRYWVGFVGSAEWAADEAGVGVFAHGKSAQDRPFFFGAKGKEVFQRYMYGSVEADWIDEFERDLISTDRSSLDWSSHELSEFREWGRQKVVAWLGQYATHRAGKHVGEIKTRAAERRAAREIPVYSPYENEQIDLLVAEATRDLGKNQSTVADELLSAVSQAWVNLPSRNLLKDLWNGLEKAPSGSATFLEVTSKLQDHTVPEAMGLAMTFAQRAYALSVLHRLVHQKSEENLQELIETFPWILQPRGDLLTADQHLKTTIEHAALDDGTKDRAGREIKGMTDRERADFVFLTDASKKTIQIVELKAPARELTAEHDRQLRDYLDFTQAFHPSATLTGLLVGHPGSPAIRTNDTRITIRGWDDILLECRATYVDLLASMIERADPPAGDTRMKLVMDFGGGPVWELLNKIAQKDENLSALMARFEHLGSPGTNGSEA
ncbi:ATP-binding protein [Terrarubrum flagellatum]|uniref:ATP-binding protein n=1 Tax=Terrirubrum flagellatum TaxID=2895980 RepID=UPI003145694C